MINTQNLAHRSLQLILCKIGFEDLIIPCSLILTEIQTEDWTRVGLLELSPAIHTLHCYKLRVFFRIYCETSDALQIIEMNLGLLIAYLTNTEVIWTVTCVIKLYYDIFPVHQTG